MSQTQNRDYVVVEKPKLSAAAILLIFLMFMQFLTMIFVAQHYNSVKDLATAVKELKSQLALLRRDVSELNKKMDRYKRVDALIELYIQQMTFRLYKEMFPNLTLEDFEKLIEKIESVREAKTKSGGIVVEGG